MYIVKNPNAHNRRGSVTAIMRIIAISILSIVVLFGVANCSPSVSLEEYNSLKEEYGSVKNELSNIESQLAALQSKLSQAAIAEAQYQSLNVNYEELQKQYNARNDELQAIKVKFDALNANYEDLKKQYAARTDETQAIRSEIQKLTNQFEELKKQYYIVVQGTGVFREEGIDQAIFALINQERKSNGVNELAWGTNLYNQAKQNSREMAETGRFQSSESGAAWKEVFWAAKYGTIDQIANAALLTWKNNDYRYTHAIINPQSLYGAVATYKYGEIYYVTYMASIFR